MYQGEIRPSTIDRLFEKVRNQSYGKYLLRMTLQNARGFGEQSLQFDFPVTALIGPNGGGKTTVLGAAAIAYGAIKPRRFFAKSGKIDESMQDWKIEHTLLDQTIRRGSPIQRTASFRSLKWYRDSLERQVSVFGVSRTVPASERQELSRCASNRFTVRPEQILPLSVGVSRAVEKILGYDVSGYSDIRFDPRGRVSLLSGRTSTGIGYSEFHFGAGEASVIRMAVEIESLEENALVLIEEIENGLHPVATRRMVEYLIEVAERKKAQVVFTTHSNAALDPLPAMAIWASLDRKLVQGKLDINALRAITGQVTCDLAVFTEDSFARLWVLQAMRARGDIALDAIEVHAMAGDGAAVAVNRHHNLDPTATYKSVCIIDGDSRQSSDAQGLVFRLPGEAPEPYVFGRVFDRLSDVKGVLAVALHQRYEDQDKVEQVVSEVSRSNRDPHIIFSQIGKRLGFIPEDTVKGAFLSVWSQEYYEEAEGILAPLDSLLPRTSAGQPTVHESSDSTEAVDAERPAAHNPRQKARPSSNPTEPPLLPFPDHDEDTGQ